MVVRAIQRPLQANLSTAAGAGLRPTNLRSEAMENSIEMTGGAVTPHTSLFLAGWPCNACSTETPLWEPRPLRIKEVASILQTLSLFPHFRQPQTAEHRQSVS